MDYYCTVISLFIIPLVVGNILTSKNNKNRRLNSGVLSFELVVFHSSDLYDLQFCKNVGYSIKMILEMKG